MPPVANFVHVAATEKGRFYGYSSNYNTPLALNWPWQQPAAFYFNGKTYFTLTIKDGAAYKIQACYLDHSTGAFATPVDVYTLADADAHRAACITVDASGYIYIFGGCSESNLYMWKSTNVESIAAWNAAVTVCSKGNDTPGNGGATYPSAFFFGSSLCVFYRYTYSSTQKYLSYQYSDDSGANWSARVDVVIPGDNHNCYPTAICPNGNKVHICWVDYDVTAVDYDEVYYAYSTNLLAWYNAAGDHSEDIISDAEAESYYLVHASGTQHQTPQDIGVDESGNPYLLTQDSGTYHFHYYSSGWQTVDITTSDDTGAYANGWLDSACLIVESSTSFKVYLTKAGIDTADGGTLEEWASTNKTSWSKTRDVTGSLFPVSATDKWRINIPKRIHNGTSGLKVLYSAGIPTDGSCLAMGYGDLLRAPYFGWPMQIYIQGGTGYCLLQNGRMELGYSAVSSMRTFEFSDLIARTCRYWRVRFCPVTLGTNYRWQPIMLTWALTGLNSSHWALAIHWYASNLYLYSYESDGATVNAQKLNTTSPVAGTWYICEMWHPVGGTTTYVRIVNESDGSVIYNGSKTTYNYDAADFYLAVGGYPGSTPGTSKAAWTNIVAEPYPVPGWGGTW